MTEKNKTEAAVYTKAQLLNSERYAGKRDLIDVLLCDGGTYSKEQVDKTIDNYMKGRVN